MQRKNNSTHLLKLNSGVPRTSLGSSFWRDLLYMAARLPKKDMGVCFTQGFIPEGMPGKWCGRRPTPPYGHSLWHVLRHRTLTSVRNILMWKCGQKPCPGGKRWRCIAKARGLGLRTHRCKKVSLVLPEKTPLHIHKIIFPKTKPEVDRYANFAKNVLFIEKLD